MDRASAGQFWFDPATMTQMRPPATQVDALVRGQELAHERAHWFQFAGSSIGTALLTLHRAEHFLLLALAGPGGPAHQAFRRAILNRERVDRANSASPELNVLGSLLDFTRAVRRELLYATAEPDDRWRIRWLGLQQLAGLTYAAHTGATSGAMALVQHLDTNLLLSSLGSANELGQLSTLHLLEAGARLSEWTVFLTTGWSHAAPGSTYTGIAATAQPYIADRLKYDGELYRRAFDLAFGAWDLPACLEHPRHAADRLGEWLPTLGACIDIALNPPMAPLEPEPTTEAVVSLPALRFLRAVEAVRDLGPLRDWPNDEDYATYRDRVAGVAGLRVAFLREASTQHERFDATFWTAAEPDDPLLPELSYFDYLLWAMERMHEFRRSHPLQWSLPGLMRQRQGPMGADVRTLIDPDFVWIHAPLYWSGNEWGTEIRLSDAVGVALILDVGASCLLKQAASGFGELSLEGVLPPEVACDEEFVTVALQGLVRGTGWEELSSWELVVPTFPDPDANDVTTEGPTRSLVEPPRCRLTITRADVERQDLCTLQRQVADLRLSPLDNRWSLELAFDSYDGDPRELWEIGEITEYFRLIDAQLPDWPWYFRPPDPSVTDCAAFLLAAFSSFIDPREPSQEEWEQLVMRVIGGFNFATPPDLDAEADWHAVAANVFKEAFSTLRGIRLD